jgi:hypothetical protein
MQAPLLQQPEHDAAVHSHLPFDVLHCRPSAHLPHVAPLAPQVLFDCDP